MRKLHFFCFFVDQGTSHSAFPLLTFVLTLLTLKKQTPIRWGFEDDRFNRYLQDGSTASQAYNYVQTYMSLDFLCNAGFEGKLYLASLEKHTRNTKHDSKNGKILWDFRGAQSVPVHEVRAQGISGLRCENSFEDECLRKLISGLR